jgi:hypothetical protein
MSDSLRHQLVRPRNPVLVGAKIFILVGQLAGIGEAMPPVARPFGEPVIDFEHDFVQQMSLGRNVGRVEENQRIPTPSDVYRVQDRHPCGQRMKRPNACFAAELFRDAVNHQLEIANELRVMVVGRVRRSIPTVIATIA